MTLQPISGSFVPGAAEIIRKEMEESPDRAWQTMEALPGILGGIQNALQDERHRTWDGIRWLMKQSQLNESTRENLYLMVKVCSILFPAGISTNASTDEKAYWERMLGDLKNDPEWRFGLEELDWQADSYLRRLQL